MSLKNKSLLFLVLLLCSGVFFADDTSSARSAWMGGYEAMNQADRAMEDNSPLAALQGYEKALKIFRKVQNDYPQWNAALLKYRVDYCLAKIEELKEANRNSAAFATKDELMARLVLMEGDIQALKERLVEKERELERNAAALERARAEAASHAAAQENIRILRGDRDVLEGQVRRLSAQLKTVEEDLKSTRASMPDLKRVQETEEQLSAAQSRLAETGRELEKSTAELKRLQAQSARDAKWREETAAELQRLRTEASQHRDRLAAADDELKMLREEKARWTQEQNRFSEAMGGNMTPEQLKAQLNTRSELLRSTQVELLTVKRRLQQAEDSLAKNIQELQTLRQQSETTAGTVSRQLEEAEKMLAENTALKQRTAEQEKALEAQKTLLASLEKQDGENRELRGRLEAELKKVQDESKRQKETIDHMVKAEAGIAANARDNVAALAQERENAAKVNAALEQARTKIGELEAALEKQQKQMGGLLEAQRDEAAKIWQGRYNELEQRLAKIEETKRDLEVLLVKRESEKQTLATELARMRTESAGLAQRESAAQSAREAAERAAQLARESAAKEQASRAEAERAAQLARESAAKEQASRAEAERAARSAQESAAREKASREEAEEQMRKVRETGYSGQSVTFIEDTAPLSPADKVILQGYLRQGVEAERSGNLETAQWNYQQALKISSCNPLALKRLGIIAANSGDDVNAARYLGQAFRTNPDDHEVLIAHGYSMIQLNQPQWALSSLARAAALRPDDATVARLYGVALSVLNWREPAISQLKRAMELNPRDSEAAYNLSMLLLQHASSLKRTAARDIGQRKSLDALAKFYRTDALKWYQTAVKNGAQADPSLEKALKEE